MFLSTCLPQNMKNQATKESHEWKIHQKHVKDVGGQNVKIKTVRKSDNLSMK